MSRNWRASRNSSLRRLPWTRPAHWTPNRHTLGASLLEVDSWFVAVFFWEAKRKTEAMSGATELPARRLAGECSRYLRHLEDTCTARLAGLLRQHSWPFPFGDSYHSPIKERRAHRLISFHMPGFGRIETLSSQKIYVSERDY